MSHFHFIKSKKMVLVLLKAQTLPMSTYLGDTNLQMFHFSLSLNVLSQSRIIFVKSQKRKLQNSCMYNVESWQPSFLFFSHF